MIGILVLLVANFLISWANAHYCGRYWSESKVTGGYFRFHVIIGYIMAIAGFTMVYGYILLLLAPYVVPLIPQFKDVDVYALMQLASDLIYLLVAATVIPIGFFIWFNSLATFWKRKTLGNALTAGWNTYAQVHNMVSASKEVPSALGRVIKALFGGKGKKKSDTMLVMLAIFIVILAVCSGYFTASAIMKKADREYDALASQSNHY